MAQSWAPEVFVEGRWSRNSLRFATKAEAAASALNLFMRWTLTSDSRATEADEPVNSTWDNEAGLRMHQTPAAGE
jgi:hypothetical protein